MVLIGSFFPIVSIAETITVTTETTETVIVPKTITVEVPKTITVEVPKVITEIVIDTVETTVTDEVTTTVLTPTTSPQLLSNPGFQSDNNGSTVTDWTVSGGAIQIRKTCGPSGGVCLKTNNVGQGGGSTISQTIDLNDTMTIDEINGGFSLAYGTDVHSDNSNAFVSSCVSVTQTTGDCRDIFSITLTLKDGGSVVEEWKNEYELTHSGWDTTTYDFTQAVGTNTYSDLDATLQLFGVDAGFFSGQFGPRFDNIHINATYDAISYVTELITRTVTEEIEREIQRTIFVPEQRTIFVPEEQIILVSEERTITTITEIEVPDAPIAMEVTTLSITPMASMTDIVEVETVEVIVTPEIDMISSISVENTSTSIETINETAAPIAVESIVSIGSSNDSNEETEVAVETKVQEVEAKVEQQMSSADTSEPATNTVESKSQESKGQDKTLNVEVDKSDSKQEIASNVANAILNTMDRYGAVAQVTQLAIMNSIGVGSQISTYQVPLLDQSTWYDNTVTIYESPQIADPFASILTGAQDLQMDALLSSGNY